MSHKRTPNYKCVVCSTDMYVRPSAMNKSAGWGFTCSKQCGVINRSKHTVGVSNHQYGLKGDKNASFKGDTKISSSGYVLKFMPNHPRANHAGYVFEHILAMETYLGRQLKYFGHKHFNNEVCHHKDRNKQNNTIDNLQLMTEKEHFELHKKEDGYGIKAGETRASFSQLQANEIVERYKKGNMIQREIADKYGVSQSVIANIVNKKRKCYE